MNAARGTSGSKLVGGDERVGDADQMRGSNCCGANCESRFFFSSRRRHTRSVSAFLLNRSSDLRGFAIQRLMNAMRQAHADGWFIVFDTLTLADDRLEAFYDNPNALRDYFRDIGRMVLAAEGRKANDS